MSKLQNIRNYLAGILFLAAVALSLWPLRATIIEDMFWHMDIQIPLLIVVGAMIKISAPALHETLSRFNAYGLNSFIASQVILAFWMLPISIDRAIIHWEYDLAKIIIGDWPATDIETTAKLERRTALFGNRGLTMFVSYHAFPLFYFSDVNLYIAIETTLCDDTYKLQYIIGESPEQIELFIKKLYLANKFIITRDYTKQWYELIYPSKGGHKRNRKMYRKSRKILRKRRRYSRKN